MNTQDIYFKELRKAEADKQMQKLVKLCKGLENKTSINLLNVFNWISTTSSILGAVYVAFEINLLIGFIFFTIGAGIKLNISIKQDVKADIALWSVFFIINVFGMNTYF